MGEAVGSLFIAMRASLAEIQGDLGKINQNVNSWSSQMKRSLRSIEDSLNRSIGGFGSLRTAMALIGPSVTALMTSRFINLGAEIVRTADRLGVSTDALQAWRFAAVQSGAGADDMTRAVDDLARKLGEVRPDGGVTAAERALGQLGLRLVEIRALSREAQFTTIIDALRGITDPAHQARVAFELMGESSTKLLTVIRAGSPGLAQAGEELQRFGGLISRDVLDRANQAAIELQKIGVAGSAAGTNIAAGFLPALQEVSRLIASPEFQTGVRTVAAGLADLTKWMIEHKDLVIQIAAAWAAAKIGVTVGRNFGPAGAVIGGATGALLGWNLASEAQRNEADRLTGRIEFLNRRLIEMDAVYKRLQRRGDEVGMLEQAQRMMAAAAEAVKAQDALNALNAEVERLANQRRPEALDWSPTVTPTPRSPFNADAAASVRKVLEDTRFRTALAREEFARLAEGFPQAVHGLGEFGQAALEAWRKGQPLEAWFGQLNAEMLKLNAAQLHTEMLTPLEKFAQDQERLNMLFTSGALSLEDYQRKLFQLRETLAQTDGTAISLQHAAQGIGQAFGTATESALTDFSKLHDVAISLLRDIHRALIQTFITKPITNSITNWLGGSGGMLNSLFGGGIAGNPWPAATRIGSAKGNVFSYGRVIPHDRGGILNKAIAWPMGSSIGTAAESSREAVMPVARGPDGKLGVMAVGDSGGIEVNYIFSPGMTPADMAFIRGQIETASRATEGRVIGMIRDKHQTDGGFLYS